MDFLEIEVGDNTVFNFVKALVLFVILFSTFKIFKSVVVSRLRKMAEKTKNEIDDELIKVLDCVKTWVYSILSLYFALKFFVVVGPDTEKFIDAVFWFTLIFQLIKSSQSLISWALYRMIVKKDGKGDQAKTTYYGIRLVVNIVLWSVGILMILSNLGINVTSLVASLGIGGVAIAFAIQNVLGDILSSFSIYFDKPFEIGDYIMIGEHDGTVKKIGLKTTRLETLQGEELVISNSELTSSRVQNFRKLKSRRVLLNFGVEYGTDHGKLKKVNEMIKKLIDEIELVELARTHFIEFGDSSLNFEVAYHVMSSDHQVYFDKQQEVNFALHDALEKEGINMAFPTRTVQLQKV